MRLAFIAYDKLNYHAGLIVVAIRLLSELKRHEHEPVALIRYHENDAPNARKL